MSRCVFATALVIALLACAAHAGSFSANPVRLVVAHGATSTSLALANRGDEPVLVQTELMAWSQRNGNDVMTPSDDLVVSPPIFKVAPGAVQTVRVGLLRRADASRELTYRLFLQEVPQPAPPGQQGVNIALRLGLPVFVMPPGRAEPQLVWRATRAQEGGLTLMLTNSGNAHVQAINCDLREADGSLIAEQQLGGYVLPGQTRSWQIKLSQAWRGEKLTLSARTDAGDITAVILAE